MNSTNSIWWWKRQRVGRLKPYTGKYSFVRLKRHYRKRHDKAHTDKFSVQIKNRKGKWKTIDEFTSECDAVDLLVKVANNIDEYRHIVGDFD